MQNFLIRSLFEHFLIRSSWCKQKSTMVTALSESQARAIARRNPQEVLLGKGVLKVRSKFIGEHPCRSGILIKLLSNLNDIRLRHGCSSVNLLHVLTTPFPKNSYDGLLLAIPRARLQASAAAIALFC